MEDERDEEIICITSSSETESESESSSSDLADDPTLCILEDTEANFSNLSINKDSKARVVRESDDERQVAEPSELDEVDEKSFEEVLRTIEAGQTEKLKVEQCKVYLRKHGLRLTGNKATLIQRINEHLEIVNDGGERKYPVSSFVMNCKGDACTGDVVLFEQNVYEMFNIASRSASGPSCGTRMVAGRIVKESYGAAKQQHTFTIEVLWSKGEKPHPPLHPLLIKGRNLYRLKTLRQKWVDEGERQKILMEKHSRGCHARSDRETRIREKEERKNQKGNRVSKKKEIGNRNQSQSDSISVPKLPIEPRQSGFSSKPVTEINRAGLVAYPERRETQYSSMYADIVGTGNHRMQYKYYNRHYHRLEPHPYTSGMNLYSGDHMNRTMREFPDRYTYRQPFSSINNNGVVHKPCRHFAQGRCNYGERCKFSHVVREEYGTRARPF